MTPKRDNAAPASFKRERPVAYDSGGNVMTRPIFTDSNLSITLHAWQRGRVRMVRILSSSVYW